MFNNSLVNINKSENNELLKNINSEIIELYKYEEELFQEFIDGLEIEVNKGYQFALARICKVPSSEKKEFMEDGYCECYKSCPFYNAKNIPSGKPCPFEQAHIKTTSETIIKELGINLDRQTIDKYTVADFVMYSLMKYRSAKALASTSLLSVSSEETKFGTNYKKELNPILGAIQIAETGMRNAKKELVATREAKLNFKLEAAKIDERSRKEKELIKKMYEKTSVENSRIDLIIDVED